MVGVPAHCAALSHIFSYISGLMFVSIRIPNGYENNIPILSESAGNEAQWIPTEPLISNYLSQFV
jgi:hypothetical protein